MKQKNSFEMKGYELGDHAINGNMESLELFKKGHKYGAGYIRFLQELSC